MSSFVPVYRVRAVVPLLIAEINGQALAYDGGHPNQSNAWTKIGLAVMLLSLFKFSMLAEEAFNVTRIIVRVLP